MRRRASGLLLHPTSLPSSFGVGDLGPEAGKFVDLLARAGQSYWQVLPLNPVDPAGFFSPYQSSSALAGNPLLISPDLLVEEGLLTPADLSRRPAFPPGRVDFRAATAYKEKLLKKALGRFRTQGLGREEEFRRFCSQEADWLEDHALFKVLSSSHGGDWTRWPAPLKHRRPRALAAAARKLAPQLEEEKFRQYLFFSQWRSLKKAANQKGINLIGDLGIYLIHQSVDVWTNPGLFKLDRNGRPAAVSGVPPDYFSSTGQLWGNPVYRWEALEETGFRWWLRRIGKNLELFDFLRLDHARGFVAFWEVKAGSRTAIHGCWREVPAHGFFKALVKAFPHLPLIAEDLGIITPDVREILAGYGLPGMKVLQFGFGPDLPSSPHAPHNHLPDSVVFPGTHDNNPTRGWWEKEAGPRERRNLAAYLGKRVTAGTVSWDLIRLALLSVARTAVIPVQDLLGLGEEARMNHPARPKGNWTWQLTRDQLEALPLERLKLLTKMAGRL